MAFASMKNQGIKNNSPFSSCLEPYYQSETKCKVTLLKKTNFRMKRFALSLASIVRCTATRKWPIGIANKPPKENKMSPRNQLN